MSSSGEEGRVAEIALYQPYTFYFKSPWGNNCSAEPELWDYKVPCLLHGTCPTCPFQVGGIRSSTELHQKGISQQRGISGFYLWQKEPAETPLSLMGPADPAETLYKALQWGQREISFTEGEAQFPFIYIGPFIYNDPIKIVQLCVAFASSDSFYKGYIYTNQPFNLYCVFSYLIHLVLTNIVDVWVFQDAQTQRRALQGNFRKKGKEFGNSSQLGSKDHGKTILLSHIAEGYSK